MFIHHRIEHFRRHIENIWLTFWFIYIFIHIDHSWFSVNFLCIILLLIHFPWIFLIHWKNKIIVIISTGFSGHLYLGRLFFHKHGGDRPLTASRHCIRV